MNVQDKVKALLHAAPAMGDDMAVELIIDAVLRSTGKLGGRPRKTGYEPVTNPFVTPSEPVSDVPPSLSPSLSPLNNPPYYTPNPTPPENLPPSPSARGKKPRRARLNPTYSPAFLACWAKYGRREEKPEAFDAWKSEAEMWDGGEEELKPRVLAALEWQAPEWAKDNWKYAVYFVRYLQRRRFNDERPATNGASAPRPTGPQLCEWHKDYKTAGKPSKFPKPLTCAECKEIAAANNHRKGEPTSIGALMGVDT